MSSFRLGYNTNGLAHHRVLDALDLLSDIGYEGVALTPDPGKLDPYHLGPSEVADVRLRSDDLGLELTVETGSRFLLDPITKHFPTLLEDDSTDRLRRVDFLERCIDLAADLGAPVVSFWSGTPPADAADTELWDRLCTGIQPLLHRAREQGVQLAFEPEPGMFIERPAGYADLVDRLGASADTLGLCLDVGHCFCTDDLPVEAIIAQFANRLVTVHLDDIADGVHEHRMFGEGELDLPATLHALIEADFDGLASVELSRDSHRGPSAAREAWAHLQGALR